MVSVMIALSVIKTCLNIHFKICDQLSAVSFNFQSNPNFLMLQVKGMYVTDNAILGIEISMGQHKSHEMGVGRGILGAMRGG